MSDEVKKYLLRNVFGTDAIFTVVTSDFVYNNITSSNVQSIMPWSEIEVPLTHHIPIQPSTLAPLYAIGLSFNLHQYDAISTPQTYSFYLNDGKWVDVRTRDTSGSLSWFHDNTREYSYSGNVLPIGALGYNSQGLGFYILVCNSDMSSHKVVTINNYNNRINYGVSGENPIWYFNAATFFSDVEPVFIPSPDPYEDMGGGEGSLPGDETIGLPSEPTLTPIDAGLFSLYSPTVQQMKNLADFLWTDFGGSGATVEQVLGEVVEALKRSVSNPLNSMLGLSIIASQGLNKGSDSSVHVGFWNTGVSMTRLNKQYFTVDCGSVTMQPVCGDTFLDYAPYSKFSIFLPYVGMRILDANDVVGHTISVKYRGDAVSGALICFIQRDGQIIAEHAGNCALNLPLTADSWAETIAGVGRMISGAASGGLSAGGGAAAAAQGAIKGAASVATNPSAFSPQVSHVGNVAGSAGHMGSQKPFILREAVRFHSTGGFNSIIGYPAYYYRKLGDCHGYTQCLDVHLSHTPATGDELKEIEELLKQGVII